LAEEHKNDKDRYVHLESGVPIFTPALEDPDPEKRAGREADQSYKDEQLALQRRIFWTQFGLVVFGLLGLGINYWQADNARYAAEVSDKGMIVAQRAERDSRVESEKTLEQMRNQSQAMRDSANSEIASNRAWVVPDFPPQHKKTIQEANLEWHNAGKTPAISVFSWKEYFVPVLPRQMRTCTAVVGSVRKQPSNLRQYQAFVPEGGKYEIGLDNTPAWNGQQPISIHGCIWYTDVSSNTEKSVEFFYGAFQNKNAFPASEGVSLFFDRPFVYK
jgi:hypothetical protein